MHAHATCKKLCSSLPFVARKKSIQTLQDAKLFQVGEMYGIYKSLNMQAFYQQLHQMEADGFVKNTLSDMKVIQITEQGRQWYQSWQHRDFIRLLHGIDYDRKERIFSLRLLLLIQTLTNSCMGYMSFIPVVDDEATANWVRNFYLQTKNRQSQVLAQIHNDLLLPLKKLPDEFAAMFVDRLTGYQSYGQSIPQLAEKYGLTYHDVKVLLTAITHFIIHQLHFRQEDFKVLPLLLKHPEKQHTTLTNTANYTYQLYNQGYDLKEIARIRKLKINTIYDHIVEICLSDPTFPIDQFVKQHDQQLIQQAIAQTSPLKLKTIKDKIGDDISYFQIRLVLAKYETV
ncbi:helix-turn-helix domain-containing protein [Virgibacillus sp. 179-BFC.A HS]|uniref:Helix-turn-helix domain-containing protein n=1 Tax=Tigheibacillus jepli TaxID=3035914 RepID=A0ABU5CH98_9BACI|nr:helix-turn-helix domain-containing protein [Virgibacillus sp. 179-BFC.A HS]MDY0405676.1 helix-turn-helix domain-containing protein [Virgibacillus sp. 179-BFC.A HS]